MTGRDIDPHHLRLLEAVLFSAPAPMSESELAERLPDGADIPGLLEELSRHYENRGVNLARAGGKWFLRTAEDLAEELRVHMTVPRRLSRAAMETLAIVAYHQPVTRAEIEEIRGVGLSRGTLDSLLEAGWIAPKGRRRTPGRPATWGTTEAFLTDFGLEAIGDLPGLDELKAAGLLDKRPAIQIADLQTGGDPVSDDRESEAEAESEAENARPGASGEGAAEAGAESSVEEGTGSEGEAASQQGRDH